MIAKAARTKSDAQKLNSTSLLVKEALSAYWNLWLAKKNHEIELDSSKVIQRGLEDAEVKLEAGTLAPAEIISLRIEEAAMKEDVAEAESALREQSITLSLLMGIAPSTKLKAGELPVETQIPDIEKARTEAKSSSYLIMEAKADIESQKVEQILASNLAEPQLDASAGLSVAGLGLGVGDAFSSMGGLDEYLISVGLTLALPLNNDALDNEAQRKAISLSLAKSQLEQTSREIDSRISVLINTLENNQKRLALAKETSQLAAQNVKAQNDRFEIGRATTLEVIDAIRSQREAEFRAVQIRVSIALAKLELEHEMGILLSRSAK